MLSFTLCGESYVTCPQERQDVVAAKVQRSAVQNVSELVETTTTITTATTITRDATKCRDRHEACLAKRNNNSTYNIYIYIYIYIYVCVHLLAP